MDSALPLPTSVRLTLPRTSAAPCAATYLPPAGLPDHTGARRCPRAVGAMGRRRQRRCGRQLLRPDARRGEGRVCNGCVHVEADGRAHPRDVVRWYVTRYTWCIMVWLTKFEQTVAACVGLAWRSPILARPLFSLLPHPSTAGTPTSRLLLRRPQSRLRVHVAGALGGSR